MLIVGVGMGLPRNVVAADQPYVNGPPYTVTDMSASGHPVVFVSAKLAEVNAFLQTQWTAAVGTENPQCKLDAGVTATAGSGEIKTIQDVPDITEARFYRVTFYVHNNTGEPGWKLCPATFTYYVDTDYHPLADEPDDSNDGDPGCDKNGESPGVVDPIHVGTGALSERETDLALNPWLTLTRFYNSQARDDAKGPLGRRWRHNYQASLAYDGNSQVRATRPCGKVLTYTSNAGTWSAYTGGVTDQLTELKDANGTRIGWRYLRDNDHGTETYDLNGQLTAVADASGLTATLTYTNGQLTSITDPYGRALSFSYDGSGRLSQVQRPDGQVVHYSYSGDLLSAVTYPGGATRNYHYDESTRSQSSQTGLLTRIDDENGVAYALYRYDAQGLATSAGHAGGADEGSVQYNAWTKAGQGSTRVTYATGLSTTLSFATTNGRMQITGMDIPCNPVCERQNATQAFDYRSGYLTSTTDFKGNLTSYRFSTDGLLQSKRESLGDSNYRDTTYTWDTTMRLPTKQVVEQRTGSANHFWTYNARGQVTVYCEMDSSAASSTACTATSKPSQGSAQLRRWTYTYCDTVDSTACPLVGLLRTVTAPNNGTGNTAYSYYLTTDESGCGTVGGACHRAGDLYQVTNAKSHVTTVVAYDKNGRVARMRDANGVLTDYTYTPRGVLQTQVVRANADGSASAQDATTQFTYDAAGNLTKLTDADGVALNYVYDDAHRLTGVVDALGNAIEYTLDAAGHKTAERITDANGKEHASLTRAFNPLGQLTRIVDGLNHTVFDASANTSYDANGNVVQSSDARGIQRQNSYDALNRLVQTLDDYQGTDASTQNAQMAYGYDVADRVTGITDPDGLNTAYTYDGLGNLTKQTSPDSGATAYTYDAAGQITKRTDANTIAATYTYDSLGRVTAKQFADGKQNLTYFYDEASTTTGCASSYPVGRLTRVAEVDVITTYCYDFQGRVVSKTQAAPKEPGELPIRDPNFGNCRPGMVCHHSVGTFSTAADAPVSDTVSYTYTPAGRLKTLTYPDGTVASYLRDAAGRITGIDLTASDGSQREAVQSVSYLPFGPIASYTLGNGQTVTRSYDANYRLTDLTSPALTLHYVRDANGNITGVTDGSASNTFNYDPLNRLTGVKDATGNLLESYAYTKTGDRTNKTGSGLATGAYGYQANTHWLTSTGNAARAYDKAGNTTGSSQAGGTLGFGYDHLNRLTVVQSDQQTIATYVYNAFGQRIGKITPDAGLRYQYDEQSQLLIEYGGATDKDYIWLDDLPVAVIDTNANDGTTQVSYVHADGLNTPRAIADESGQTIWSWSALGNPFGEQQPTSTAGYVYNLRYPGQYYDAESGLHYNVNRYYDPTAGRYAQSDPMGYAGGQASLYGYVDGNPLIYTDPLGTTIWSGTYMTISGGRFGVQGTYYRFQLLSQPVKGKISFITVTAKAAGFGMGVPVSATGGSITFNDHMASLNPEVFNGDFLAISAGGAGVIGGGWSSIVAGGATSSGYGALMGYDGSVSIVAGSSKVISVITVPYCDR